MCRHASNVITFRISIFILLVAFIPVNAGTIFVNETATGANNGSSWTDAYTNLQSAMGTAVSLDEIWVAAGTYKPAPGSVRTGTFLLLNGVALYGGFAGNEASVGQRDWDANVSVLSGDIGVVGISTDNSYHVVTGSWTNSTAILDGFTVTGGRADVYPDHTGGGMYNDAGSPMIRNIIFTDCFASHSGGGMRNDASSPTLLNVTFLNNYADTHGGGMYNYRYSNVILINVTFTGNTTYEYGGGMYNDDSHPVLNYVTFQGNSCIGSPTLGGGMYNDTGSRPELTDVTFAGNSAERGGGLCSFGGSAPALVRVIFSENNAWRGGGMYSDTSDPTLVNVVFQGNEATGTNAFGGGMYNRDNSPELVNVTFSGNVADDGSGGGISNLNSTPSITNVILWGNTAVTSGNEIYNVSSTPVISYSLIENCGVSSGAWDTSLGTDGGNNIDTDPSFKDTATGNLRIWSSSHAIEAGNNAAVPAGITTDLDGNTRIYGMYVDIGAYEYQGIPTGIGDDPASMPQGPIFRAVYPNPFNPSVIIEFDLAQKKPIRLSIYDAGGRLVRILVDEIRDPGPHQVIWNGRDKANTAVSSGMYFVRFESDGLVTTKKIVLLR
ncbi:MAG: T9SS type A sorting domain-containing protein [Bacteroidales bacterium]|nr:T9SS type A sorting domain-containing protein [Candidatus Latescibacterota bacterium]